jgi:hypothetical protein
MASTLKFNELKLQNNLIQAFIFLQFQTSDVTNYLVTVTLHTFDFFPRDPFEGPAFIAWTGKNYTFPHTLSPSLSISLSLSLSLSLDLSLPLYLSLFSEYCFFLSLHVTHPHCIHAVVLPYIGTAVGNLNNKRSSFEIAT